MNINVTDMLKQSGLKLTKQRKDIIKIFINTNHLLTADDIYSILSNNNSKYGLATVYRTLSSLCEKSIIQTVNIPFDNSQYFILSESSHIHHLICIKCKKCIIIDICPVEQFSLDLAKKNGFEITNHSFQILGLCSRCKNKSVE